MQGAGARSVHAAVLASVLYQTLDATDVLRMHQNGRAAERPGGSSVSRRTQTARKLSAEDLPVFGLGTTSKETFCPSLRLCIPARSTALTCTKTSLPPSSGWMNPTLTPPAQKRPTSRGG